MSAALEGVIRNGRVEVGEPIRLPEGTAVVTAPEAASDDGPVAPEEIARVLAAMHKLHSHDDHGSDAADLSASGR